MNLPRDSEVTLTHVKRYVRVGGPWPLVCTLRLGSSTPSVTAAVLATLLPKKLHLHPCSHLQAHKKKLGIPNKQQLTSMEEAQAQSTQDTTRGCGRAHCP